MALSVSDGMADLVADLLPLAASLYVGSSLLAGGIAKVRDFRGTWVGVLDYRMVPRFLARPLAAVLALSEIGCGLALMLGVAVAAPLAVLLFGVLTAAAVSALLRGLEIDCHCGPAAERLTIHTLGRNALVMLAMIVVIGSSASPSPLEPRLLNVTTAAALCLGLGMAFALIASSSMRVWLSTSPSRRPRRLA